MVDSRKRATASLKVKYKSATLGQFTQQFGLDISHAGMFIKTKSPLEPGALLRLELQLSDATPVIQGSGRVKWRRMPGPEGALPAGMGIEFIRLEIASRALVDRIVDAREGRPSRFEQTDGAQVVGASQPLPSALTSSLPPATAALLPSITPSPAPSVLPPAAATPPPPVSTPSAVGPSGLFTSSGLRGHATQQTATDLPAQSSFFARIGAAPRHDPAPRHADTEPARPRLRSESEDEITNRFREPPTAGSEPPDESAITGQHLTHPEDGAITAPLGRTPELGAATATEPDDDASPANVSPALNLDLSSLQPPARSRSTTLVWVIVLALCAVGVAFYFLRHEAGSSGQRSPQSSALAHEPTGRV